MRKGFSACIDMLNLNKGMKVLWSKENGPVTKGRVRAELLSQMHARTAALNLEMYLMNIARKVQGSDTTM